VAGPGPGPGRRGDRAWDPVTVAASQPSEFTVKLTVLGVRRPAPCSDSESALARVTAKPGPPSNLACECRLRPGTVGLRPAAYSALAAAA
jgi:hypothetical protein